MALLLIAGLLLGGIVDALSSQTAITFFYIVNRSWREARIHVTADGQELFAQEIEAARESTSRIQEAPPSDRYPARELKVRLPLTARRLVVEELNSAGRATFDLPQGNRSDAGFRIVIDRDAICITHDYMPIRSQ